MRMLRLGWIVAVCLTASIGGLTQPSPRKTPPEQKRAPRPRPQQATESYFSDKITSVDGLHDTYLDLYRSGNASAMPFLIRALALEGDVPAEGPYGGPCSRFHCLHALQRITNQDVGRNARDWSAWYERNKVKSEHEWVLDGFMQAKLPVHLPVDAIFAKALMHAIGSNQTPQYLRTNAERMLLETQRDLLVNTVRELLKEEDSGARHGALDVLGNLRGKEAIPILRPLRDDPDPWMAQNSLRLLNEAIRESTPATKGMVWERTFAQDSVRILAAEGNGETVFLTAGLGVVERGRVMALSPGSPPRIKWTYFTGDAVRSSAATLGNRLFFASDDGVLHCLTFNGRLAWKKRVRMDDTHFWTGPQLMPTDNGVLLIDGSSIRLINPANGAITASVVSDAQFHGPLVMSQRHIYGASAKGELFVLSLDGVLERRMPLSGSPRRVSADGQAVCVMSDTPEPPKTAWYLRCFEEESLQQVARVTLDQGGTFPDLHQDGGVVYVRRQEGTAAYNATSGKRVWTTNEFAGFSIFHLMGSLILTVSGHGKLEWLDAATGEVRATYSEGGTRAASNPILLGDRILIEGSKARVIPKSLFGLLERKETVRLLSIPTEIQALLAVR